MVFRFGESSGRSSIVFSDAPAYLGPGDADQEKDGAGSVGPQSLTSHNPKYDLESGETSDSESDSDSDSDSESGSSSTGHDNEEKWYKTRKAKYAFAGFGLVALLGVVAGVASGGSESSPIEDTPGAGTGGDGGDPPAAEAYQFPLESFGVQSPLIQYPGYTGPYPTGHVSLKADNVFSWQLEGLTPNTSGGIHIHEGSSCDSAGGHWFKAGQPDGWTETKWTSDASGKATGYIDVDEVPGAYPFQDNVARTVVVHDENGARVACGAFQALTTDIAVVKAKLAKYPESDPAQPFPSGFIFLSKDNVLTWNMDNLEPDAVGGIHIHEGLTCETAGSHFFKGSFDPWTNVKYSSTSTGSSSGSYDLKTDAENLYEFSANVQRTVVVHNKIGIPAACGVLIPYTEMDDNSADQDVAQDQYYSVSGKFMQYPGGPSEHPRGKVWLDSNNVLSWTMSNLEQDVEAGIHIHEGKVCDSAGGHFWDKTSGPDPWVTTKYTSNSRGRSYGKIDVDDLVASFPAVANFDRTVVIHDASGARVACAELRAKEDYGVRAVMGQYPGGTVDFPQGRVVLDNAGVITWNLYNLEENQQGGIHIHEGTSCDFSKGHHYDVAKADGWLDTKWSSNSQGASRGMLLLSQVEGAFPYELNVGRTVVLHNSAGARVACGVLKPYVFYPEREEDGVEWPSFDYSVGGRFRKYPTNNDRNYPRGRAYLDSENILSYELRGLKANEQGGIHIHEGTSCDNSGGHHYTGSSDPWMTTMWSSSSAGRARGVIDVGAMAGAYDFAGNVNHVVVVHDEKGKRVSCAKLKSNANFGVMGYMGTYPGLPDSSPLAQISGKVFLSRDNKLAWYLTGLESKVSGGIHIHAATGPNACETDAGPHWWDQSAGPDPWNVIEYDTTKYGSSRGVIDLDLISAAHDFNDNSNHAVVIHASDGTRVGCAVLEEFLPDVAEEMELAEAEHDGLEEGEEYDSEEHYCDNYVVRGKLDAYPGMSSELSAPKGIVRLNSDNILTFYMKNLPADAKGGIHIHAGQTCEESGGHWYQGETDPWTVTLWDSNSRGVARGFIDVQALTGSYHFAANLNHAVVIHDPAGNRVACTVLSTRRRKFGMLGKFERYAGLADEVSNPDGFVFLTMDNKLSYRMTGLEKDKYGAVHIHEGSSCDASGGHHFVAGQPDFWNDVGFMSNILGEAKGTIDMAKYPLAALPFDQNAYRTVVVHNSAGTRVACAVLNTFRFQRGIGFDFRI